MQEYAPLSNESEKTRQPPSSPQRTRHKDLPNITRTVRATAINDPLYKYISEHRVRNRWRDKLQQVLESMTLSKFIDHRTAWVVDSGDAFIFYSDPAKHDTRRHKLLSYFASIIRKLTTKAEQKRRHTEFMTKMNAALKASLGDRMKEMYYLDHLATIPAKQGRGYATTLCRVFTDEADMRGLASYLVSSNVEANTRFYNHVGFRIVKEFLLGDDNPTWKRAPVVIAIMVREVPL